MGIFLENEDDSPYPPTQAIPPSQFNIDPSTTRFAPLEYSGMLAQGAANWMTEDVIPAVESVGNYWHQKMLPGGEQVEDPMEKYNKPAKESEPLLAAIESGYADKKVMNPVQMIRESVRKGDMEGIEKGHRKLVDLLSDTGMTWGQRFADLYLRGGVLAGQRERAGKMAADVVMKEMLGGSPRAMEATSAGLMSPGELLPEQRMPVYQHLVPPQDLMTGLGPEYGIENEPMSTIQPSLMAAQPGQIPSTEVVDPMATLTPLQESLVDARTKSQTHPMQPRAGKSVTPSDINMRGIQADEDVIRSTEGREPTPQERSTIAAKWSGYDLKAGELDRKKELDKSLTALRAAHSKLYESYGDRAKAEIDLVAGRGAELEAKVKLLEAQTEYKKQEPQLQRELQGMKAASHPQHYVFQAIARVRQALEKGETPNEVDSALFHSFLTKGSGEYGTTFLGELYNRYTGKMVEPDKPVNKGGMLSVLKEYMGKLFGSDAAEEQEKLDELVPDQGMPTPKTPEEAAKLKPGTKYKRPDGKVMVR
jgi:hypothetical protein